MKNIKEFNSCDDVKKFIKKNIIRKIGVGSEGECFLGKGNKVYKYIDYDNGFSNSLYSTKDIITKNDIDLKSFEFPDEVYDVDGNVSGYRCNYIKNNYFKTDNIIDFNAIKDLDLDKLYLAYYKMLNDIYVLSENNISIYDLSYNLIFDGEDLYAIDTLGYKRTKKNPLEHNIQCLNHAITDIFIYWFYEIGEDLSFEIEGTDIGVFLNKLEDLINQFGSDRGFEYMYSI